MEDQTLQQNTPPPPTPEFETPPSRKGLWAGVAIAVIVVGVAVVLVLTREKSPHTPTDTMTGPAGTTAQPTVVRPVTQGRVFIESQTPSVVRGSEFVVEVFLDTQGYNINLANVELLYDTDRVTLVDALVRDTVMTIAAADERTPGSVSIARGIPGNANYQDSGNGFTGERGLFAQYTFTSVSPGAAQFLLGADTVLYLDDGHGSPMQTERGELTITIQ